MPRITGWSDDEFDDRARDLAALIRRVWRAIARLVAAQAEQQNHITMATAKPIITQWQHALDNEVVGYIQNLYLDAAGLVSDELNAPEELLVGDDLVEIHTNAARNRLVGIGDDVWRDVQAQIAMGNQAGESVTEIAERIRNVTGVSMGRAMTIARTEVHAALEAGTYEQAMFVDPNATKIWLATEDERTRPSHRRADGQKARIGAPFKVGGTELRFPGDPLGDPGETINCVVGSTEVDALLIQMAMRSRYDGNVITIKTATGKTLTVTPNHPVLVRRGDAIWWQAAHELQVGDYAVCGDIRRHVSQYDEQRRPTVVSEVFDLAQVLRNAEGEHFPANFHGERRMAEVRVVAEDRLLGLEVVPTPKEKLPEFLFSLADWTSSGTSGAQSRPLSLNVAGARGGQLFRGENTPSQIRVACQCSVLIRGTASGDQTIRRNTTSSDDPGITEHSNYCTARDAKALAEGVNAFSVAVSLDEIVDIVEDHFSGHVYNLSTTSGWYTGNGIISGNCRCSVAYDFDMITPVSDEEPELAVVAAGQKKWKPENHPRGSDGKFIEKGALNDFLKKAKPNIVDVTNAVGQMTAGQYEKLTSAQKQYLDDSVEKLPKGTQTYEKTKKNLDIVKAMTKPKPKAAPKPKKNGFKTKYSSTDDVDKMSLDDAVTAVSYDITPDVAGTLTQYEQDKLKSLVQEAVDNGTAGAVWAQNKFKNWPAPEVDAPDFAPNPTKKGPKPATEGKIPAGLKGKPGDPAKITTGVVWGKHSPGDVILEGGEGLEYMRVVWNGKKFELQTNDSPDGSWVKQYDLSKKDFYANHKTDTGWVVPGAAKTGGNGYSTDEETGQLLDDVLGPETTPEPPQTPSTPPVSTTSEPDWTKPQDFSGFSKIGGQAGSNLGGKYKAPDGTEWYLKKPKSAKHAANEQAASAFYNLAGINAPQVMKGKGSDLGSGLQTGTKIVPGAQANLGSKLNDSEYIKEIQSGFAMDAWLANWDVAGMGYDNVVEGADGKPHRIDVGGALLFRAQGDPKGDKFGDTVEELETLRNPGMNPTSAKIFGPMTNEDIRKSVAKLEAITNEQIDKIVSDAGLDYSVAQTLKNRRSYILSKYPPIKSSESPTPAAPESPWAGYDKAELKKMYNKGLLTTQEYTDATGESPDAVAFGEPDTSVIGTSDQGAILALFDGNADAMISLNGKYRLTKVDSPMGTYALEQKQDDGSIVTAFINNSGDIAYVTGSVQVWYPEKDSNAPAAPMDPPVVTGNLIDAQDINEKIQLGEYTSGEVIGVTEDGQHRLIYSAFLNGVQWQQKVDSTGSDFNDWDVIESFSDDTGEPASLFFDAYPDTKLYPPPPPRDAELMTPDEMDAAFGPVSTPPPPGKTTGKKLAKKAKKAGAPPSSYTPSTVSLVEKQFYLEDAEDGMLTPAEAVHLLNGVGGLTPQDLENLSGHQTQSIKTALGKAVDNGLPGAPQAFTQWNELIGDMNPDGGDTEFADEMYFSDMEDEMANHTDGDLIATSPDGNERIIFHSTHGPNGTVNAFAHQKKPDPDVNEWETWHVFGGPFSSMTPATHLASAIQSGNVNHQWLVANTDFGGPTNVNTTPGAPLNTPPFDAPGIGNVDINTVLLNLPGIPEGTQFVGKSSNETGNIFKATVSEDENGNHVLDVSGWSPTSGKYFTTVTITDPQDWDAFTEGEDTVKWDPFGATPSVLPPPPAEPIIDITPTLIAKPNDIQQVPAITVPGSQFTLSLGKQVFNDANLEDGAVVMMTPDGRRRMVWNADDKSYTLSEYDDVSNTWNDIETNVSRLKAITWAKNGNGSGGDGWAIPQSLINDAVLGNKLKELTGDDPDAEIGQNYWNNLEFHKDQLPKNAIVAVNEDADLRLEYDGNDWWTVQHKGDDGEWKYLDSSKTIAGALQYTATSGWKTPPSSGVVKGVGGKKAMPSITTPKPKPSIAPQPSAPQPTSSTLPPLSFTNIDEIWKNVQSMNVGTVLGTRTNDDGHELRLVVGQENFGVAKIVEVQTKDDTGNWTTTNTLDKTNLKWELFDFEWSPVTGDKMSAVPNIHDMTGTSPDQPVMASYWGKLNSIKNDVPGGTTVAVHKSSGHALVKTYDGAWAVEDADGTQVGMSVLYAQDATSIVDGNWYTPTAPTSTLTPPQTPAGPSAPKAVPVWKVGELKNVLKANNNTGYWSKPEKIWESIKQWQSQPGNDQYSPLDVLKALDKSLKTSKPNPYEEKMVKWASTPKGIQAIGGKNALDAPAPSTPATSTIAVPEFKPENIDALWDYIQTSMNTGEIFAVNSSGNKRLKIVQGAGAEKTFICESKSSITGAWTYYAGGSKTALKSLLETEQAETSWMKEGWMPAMASGLEVPSSVTAPKSKKKIELPDIETGNDISGIADGTQKIVYDKFKTHPGTYLKSPAGDIFDAIQSVAKEEGLTLAQVINIVDAQGAIKVNKPNEGLFKQKLADWLKTPEAAAHINNEPEQVKGLPTPPAFLPQYEPDKTLPSFEESNKYTYDYVPSVSAASQLWNEMVAKSEPMSASQESALKTWTGGSYHTINHYLFKPNEPQLSPTHKSAMNGSQKGMRPSTKPMIIVRGTGYEGLGNAKNHAQLEKLVGSTWRNNAFAAASVGSASHDAPGVHSPAFSSYPLWIEFECPPGTPMAWLDPFSQHKGEREMLLPANLHYKILSVEKKNIPGYGMKSVARVRIVPKPSEEATE